MIEVRQNIFGGIAFVVEDMEEYSFLESWSNAGVGLVGT